MGLEKAGFEVLKRESVGLIDEFQNGPEAGVFGNREFQAGSKPLPVAAWGLNSICQAKHTIGFDIKPIKGLGGEENGQAEAAFVVGEKVCINGIAVGDGGVGQGTIDADLAGLGAGSKSLLWASLASNQNGGVKFDAKLMAESSGSVHISGISGIDPDIEFDHSGDLFACTLVIKNKCESGRCPSAS